MKANAFRTIVLLVALSLLLWIAPARAQAPDPGPQNPDTVQAVGEFDFTYQGRLTLNGSPVNGTCDMEFKLYEQETSVTPLYTIGQSAIAVNNGLFTTVLEFGWRFGAVRYLEIGVRCPAGSGTYTTLSPRQPLTATPMALSLPGVRVESSGGAMYGPNIIAGHGDNDVAPGVWGATIAGGGADTGCGDGGTYTCGNMATGRFAFIGGGEANQAGDRAVIGGGRENAAYGSHSVIPGGRYNKTDGDQSFASGYYADAAHDGAFVWSDSSAATYFSSTTNNQFLVRATGGVGINTNDTIANGLTVNGRIIAGGTGSPAGSAEPFVARGSNSGISLEDRNNAAARWVVYPLDGSLNFWNGSNRATLSSTGVLKIDALGSAGATSLCLNASEQIASCSSSARYKTAIQPLDLGLDTLAQLRPVKFQWAGTGEPDLGLVAEEVQQVTPLLATRNEAGQTEGVKYDRLSALLVKGIQEQQAQIAELQAQNNTLKTQNNNLETRLTALEQAVQARQTIAPAGVSPNMALLLLGGLLGVGLTIVLRPRGAQ